MIIFDLDGTLADCEHRRHFVDSNKLPSKEDFLKWQHSYTSRGECPKWKPDYKSFYEACDKDEPIQPVIQMFKNFRGAIGWEHGPYIWSGRCESVREKTIHWLIKNLGCFDEYHSYSQVDSILKMRPIGNTEPDDQLKERWLDQVIDKGEKIDFVFDDRKKVCNMWRRHGIFVFNCCQHDGEF